jgi:hypothetical protein
MLTRNCRTLQQRGKYPSCQIIATKCYGLFLINYKSTYQLLHPVRISKTKKGIKLESKKDGWKIKFEHNSLVELTSNMKPPHCYT